MVFTANKQSFSISISNHIHLALHSKTERKQGTRSRVPFVVTSFVLLTRSGSCHNRNDGTVWRA
jgi:hypothetical protein